MVAGQNGPTGARALNSATVMVMVQGLAQGLAQIPRVLSGASFAADIRRRTSVAKTTIVLVRVAMLNV